MKLEFNKVKETLSKQFSNICWINDSGLDEAELQEEIEKIENLSLPIDITKARIFQLIAQRSRIAIDKEDIFQDKLFSGDLMLKWRGKRESLVFNKYFPAFMEENDTANACGAYVGCQDFGHTSPNSARLLELGFSGLLHRIEEYSSRDGLTEKQKNFYLSCSIVLTSMMHVAKRLSDAIRPYNTDAADALLNISVGAPRDSYEAMQLIILYFFLHEYVAGTRVRTLGRLDVLLDPFFKKDKETGRYTDEELREMMRYFLSKFSSADVPYGLPFCISGMDRDGHDVTCETTHLIVEVYNELDIYSPKIHVRVSPDIPEEFFKKILGYIRAGHSSFVLTNDTVAIRSLEKVGIETSDARDYVPIGCYEPAVWGIEVGCTGNGYVNLSKALELIFNGGKDIKTGTRITPAPKGINDWSSFIHEVKEIIRYMTDRAMTYVITAEKYYSEINPDAILSSQYDRSVETGVDLYEGGAKYNNSSMYFRSIASFIDGLCAVKRIVYDEKRYTAQEFGKILKDNWKDHEVLRREIRRFPEKYGNNNKIADDLTREMTQFSASIVNNQPNGRGGVFKAALFSIHDCFTSGKKTAATPEGRFAGEPLSKNLCADFGMDKNGITALISSVTEFDHSDFPTGSVLDFVIHPSAICGEEGLNAFKVLADTYFRRGGYALHGNVFDANALRAAQRNPEKYKNLQVRVCGWNAYFNNLPKEQQDAFIIQAECAI